MLFPGLAHGLWVVYNLFIISQECHGKPSLHRNTKTLTTTEFSEGFPPKVASLTEDKKSSSICVSRKTAPEVFFQLKKGIRFS